MTTAECGVLTMTHGEHHIEEGVRIYLDWDGKAWKVSSSTVDGHSLDSTRDDGANCDYAPHWELDQSDTLDELAEAECSVLLNEAEHADLPTALELIPLIGEHLSTEELIFAIRDLAKLLGDRNG